MPPFDEEELVDDFDEEQEDQWVGLGEEGAPGFRAALFSHFNAADYAKYRPHYPEQCYQRVYHFASLALGGRQPGQNSQELALDIGCGPGNVAVQLAKVYAQVVGVDPSQAQLDHAIKRPNIRYLQVAAEFLTQHLSPQSVDLIAMAETLHWVDHIQFYEEARRVLKPTGVLAIWCYDLNQFSQFDARQDPEALRQANALMRSYCYGVLGSFWDERRVYIDRHYAGLEPRPSQFSTVVRQESSMEHVMSMSHLIGFLRSWSPYAAYRQTYPDKRDPLIDLAQQFRQLLAVTDDDAQVLRITWPLFFLLIRGPVQ